MKNGIYRILLMSALFGFIDTVFAESNSLGYKPVFDTTGYLNKNKANESLFIPMKILYENKLLPMGPNAPIDTEHLTRLALSLPVTKVPYILDIEAWKVRHDVDDFTASKSIDKYILVIDTMKKARPDLKFGYFGLPPVKGPIIETQPSQKLLNEWHHALERSRRLVAHVDVLCPECYTYFNNREAWVRYVHLTLKEAKSYGKPIYPFVWSEFMDSTPLRGQFIPRDFWKLQLDLLNKQCDGIIVWGGPDFNTHQKREWDENAPWWIETKALIYKNKQLADNPVKTDISQINRVKPSSKVNTPKKQEVIAAPVMKMTPAHQEVVKPPVKRIQIIKE